MDGHSRTIGLLGDIQDAAADDALAYMVTRALADVQCERRDRRHSAALWEAERYDPALVTRETMEHVRQVGVRVHCSRWVGAGRERPCARREVSEQESESEAEAMSRES